MHSKTKASTFFHEHYQSVKKFGSRSGPTFCQSSSGSKMFAKVISRRQKSLLASQDSTEIFKEFLRKTVTYFHSALLGCYLLTFYFVSNYDA